MKKQICQSNSEAQTRMIASNFVRQLTTGAIVLLKGNLGSGKTTFVRGVADALNLKPRITSPTFVLMKVYPTQYKKIKHLVHLDLYRLTTTSIVGIEDYLTAENLVLIEWPEKITSILPKQKIKIFFKNLGENKREIKIVPYVKK